MVYVVILNWNGWSDTLECLESVFRSDHRDFRVVVCDNASANDSLSYIKAWADGRLNSYSPGSNSLHALSYPPVEKPIAFAEYARNEAEHPLKTVTNVPLVLIQTGANLGYAGGNNVGLRFCLQQEDFEYAWILNNDTVVEPSAMRKLVESIRAKPQAGICGSTLLYYYSPDEIQTLGGGTYFVWHGNCSNIQAHKPWKEYQAGKHQSTPDLDYVSGASALVSKQFIQSIGLMCEEYFLFFEEIDWAVRARNKFQFIHAPESIVYHKEGRGTKLGAQAGTETEKGDFAYSLSVKNRILFTRKFFPYALPTVYAGLFLTILNRIRLGQWKRARIVFNIIFGLR